MKKFYIFAISIILSTNTNFILSNEQNCSGENNNLTLTQELTQDSQIDKNINNTELDELDALSQDAEDNGVKIEPIAKPTYLMNMVRKVGVVFFLKPYILFVDSYRITKDFVIKYSTMAWEKIVGKKPEEVTNGTAKQ